MNFSVFEVLMLLCFACSWPISIYKAIKTKIVIGKSPVFMVLLIIGYLMGIIHKFLYNYDIVTYLYMFNMTLVTIDLILYLKYIKANKRDLASLSNQKK
ncbi:MAG: hypothetical protein J6T30_00310 [Bacteroidales bacterium]|nr:hypothetical protein [Bacteroidales bacterium]